MEKIKGSESRPWWKCCCPKKGQEDSDSVTCCSCPRKAREEPIVMPRRGGRRRTSVQVAEEKLQNLVKTETDDKQIVEAKFLPLTFIPDFIVMEIFDDGFGCVPYVVTSNVVLVMVDVCGFTSLCESYCQQGISGIEELANVLNGFMSTLSAMILEAGGDILNFAGDAFLVQWTEEGKMKGLRNPVIKAYECAVALQTHHCLKEKNLDGTMKVKIGLAVGEISTWILGCPNEFLLFVAAGRTLPLVQQAEDKCSPGDIVVTEDIYEVLKDTHTDTYTTTVLEDGYIKITECEPPESEDEPVPNRISLFESCLPRHITMAKTFLIPALRGLKSADELQYVSELTMVTILFVALLNVEVAEPKVLDRAFDIILDSVKKFKGVLNKMLLFDKGCTFLVAFGLPGLKHYNDAARGISCADSIVTALNQVDIQVSIGITSGTCFCGMVGHPQRQEYTVIGSRVNMAARIMVVYNDHSIAMDGKTYHLSREELGDQNFHELPSRKMKGIESSGAIYAYRKKKVSKRRSTTTFVEDSNLHGSDKLKGAIKECIAAMCDDEERKKIMEKTLLPVLIIKGQNSTGKNYLIYFSVDAAVAMNCKFAICCAIPSYSEQPYFVVSRLIRHMLGMTMNESSIDRENIIMCYLPISEMHDFYLLNHLFIVEFPVPKDVSASIDYRNEKITKLCKMIILQFSRNRNTIIAIDNADHIDDESWHILHALSEEDRILIVLSLSLDFREDNSSASNLILKAVLHINMESLEEDFFAPVLCWFLGVRAVHTGVFAYLKEITHGRTQLLKEISLSPATFQFINIVPFEDIDPERMSKEFYVDEFEVLKDDEPWACDIKPGTDLREAIVPSNINDAVKESFNNLTIQDRLLLKRAAVLGVDFDLHTLECVSAGMKRSEVLESINNLLYNHIFASVCTLEHMVDTTSSKVPSVTLTLIDTCFCFVVYLRTRLKCLNASEWPIGPYHRLKFRTQEYRSCILAYMTKDQLYSMRMEIADNLEKSGPECATCKSKRIEGMELKEGSAFRVRRYTMSLTRCTCLEQRPKIYSEVSVLYASVGMVYLPPFFMKKAAQAKNKINLPIEALHYVQMAEKIMPKYWLMSDEDRSDAESYFDSLSLEASMTRTKAESFLLLGDTYHAASHALTALENLGLDALCFHGVFTPKQFKKILPKFRLLHAENITKLIGILAKTYLQSNSFKLAQELLRIEYYALKLYPTDFLQVLNHMTAMFQLKYFIFEKGTLQELQDNIFRLCRDKLRNIEVLLDLTELVGIGNAYGVIVEINLVLGNLDKAEATADEAIRILQMANGGYDVLSNLRILLAHLYFHKKDYLKCWKVIKDLGEMEIITSNRIPRALYICSLSMFLRKSTAGIKRKDVGVNFDKCNAFGSEWKNENAQVMTKDMAFYVSISLARWCLFSESSSLWIAGKSVFKTCYEMAVEFYKTMGKVRHNYWAVTAILLLLKLQVQSLEENINGVSADEHIIQEELSCLKHRIKTYYPIHMKTYEKLVASISKKENEQSQKEEPS